MTDERNQNSQSECVALLRSLIEEKERTLEKIDLLIAQRESLRLDVAAMKRVLEREFPGV